MTWREYLLTWLGLLALISGFAVIGALAFAWLLMPAFMTIWTGDF